MDRPGGQNSGRGRVRDFLIVRCTRRNVGATVSVAIRSAGGVDRAASVSRQSSLLGWPAPW
jgi:hypothetical protein